MKVSDSLDNVPNENVVTHLGTDRPTDRLTDQLLELLEWLFATKNCCMMKYYNEFEMYVLKYLVILYPIPALVGK